LPPDSDNVQMLTDSRLRAMWNSDALIGITCNSGLNPLFIWAKCPIETGQGNWNDRREEWSELTSWETLP